MQNYFKPLLVAQALLVLLTTSGVHAFRKDRRDAERGKPRTEQQLDRVKFVMLPLLQATDRRIAADDVRLTIVEDAAINAASAGGFGGLTELEDFGALLGRHAGAGVADVDE